MPKTENPADTPAHDVRIRAGVRPGTTRTVQVDYLARVEGEGGLRVYVRDGQVEDVELRIFEPPRFFEAFLRGRGLEEAPDITARICGICPVAYQMSAVHALERALAIPISPTVRALRRLLYCGEWIESHGLHVYMLHAPDFFGLPDAVQLAKQHPTVVERGLRLKKIGNEILRVLGGREVHPINVRVGGFYKLPSVADLRTLSAPLAWARDAAIDTARFVAALPIPHAQRNFDFVALHHPDEYALNEGRVTNEAGLSIDARDFEDHFVEQHVARSNALHSLRILPDGTQRPYFVGPLARYNLNFAQLPPLVRQVAADLGFARRVDNPFESIVVRALEIVFACDEALRIIDGYRADGPAYAPLPQPIPESVGWAVTEAPRGLIYHRYRITSQGTIADAKIVPPTSQNQKTIELDLRDLVRDLIAPAAHKSQPPIASAALTARCEQAVRNYDPCISCATHFLNVQITDLSTTPVAVDPPATRP